VGLGVQFSGRLPVTERLSLVHGLPRHNALDYPSDALQKGWLLSHDGHVLAEEGTGFALPMARYGHRTIFPASAYVSVASSEDSVTAAVTYELALVERLALGNGKSIRGEAFYRARECFSAIHRKVPPWRGVLTPLFDGTRAMFRLATRFEPCETAGTVRVITTVPPGEGRIVVSIDFDLERRGCTEVIIANEQGASHFNLYRDSSGASLEKNAIGSWGEVASESASLVDPRDGVMFTLSRLPGMRLFRGWEMKPGRLAWAGLNYVLPPDVGHFEYGLRIAEL
jgi:hypothetical protein